MNSSKKKQSLTKLLSLSEQLLTKPKWHKNISTLHEDLNVRIKLISNEIQVIKATLQLKDKDINALEGAAKLLNKKLKGTIKELQKAQKRFAKKRAEIQTKLLVPAETIDCSSKTLYEATKENCKKIEEIIKISRSLLEEDGKLLDDSEQALRPVLQKLAKLTLSQTIEGCANSSLDLKERLEAIVKSTADMSTDDTPAQLNPVTIKNVFTLLRDRCTSNVKLLDLVSVNIKKVFPETEVNDDKKQDKKEGKQEENKDNKDGAANGVASNKV